jgi:hypothetical protein
MVNLIIISNSPKLEHIERLLQTTIEVKIDVVADIDQALRDIFVKRPAVVCIQNRISDVNADEIARHIKMLLRNGAPSFILMHEGDGSAKPAKGLFEHLLDLTLPETKLAEDLGAALNSILGTQREHVRPSSRPQNNKPLETTGTTPESPQESPGAEEQDAFVLVKSLDEFMTTMPEARDMGWENSAHPDNALTAAAPRKSVSSRQLSVEYGEPAKSMTHESLSPEDTAAPSETSAPPFPSSTHPAPPPRPARAHTAARAAQQDNRPGPEPYVWAPSAAPAPGDFRITTTAAATAGVEQNDIAPFIENFEQPDRKWKRRAGIALAIVVCTAAWYLLRQKPMASTPVPLPTHVTAAVHKAISSVHPPPVGNAAAPKPALPAFVPANGRDSAYATSHPGWERYAGTGYECRVFRVNNRIKAVQVLAGNRQGLDEDLLKKVLAELVGNDHYRVVSRERVRGYLIERGSAVGKADLMLYTQNSKLHAFVVSLN